MNIREAYEQSLQREGHVKDPAQLEVIARFEDLQARLLNHKPARRGLAGLFGRRASGPGIKGLYLWGGVGRGKTFLMDLFFEALPIEAKKRIHFHRIMHEVHDRLKSLRDIEDPLDTVAADTRR